MSAADNRIELTVAAGGLVRVVLGRVISAAAAQAALPVERVIDAMSVVDALCDALDNVLEADRARRFVVEVGAQSVELSTLGLSEGEVEAVEAAAVIPAVGAVFERLASVGRSTHDDRPQLLLELR